MNKKFNDVARQRKIMFASFMYFALVLDMNKNNKIAKPSKKLMMLYRRLGYITKGSMKHMETDIADVNKVVKRYKKQDEIDYLLASVTIISVYYELTKGHKRWFYPMSYEQILELQDEIIENLEQENQSKMVNQTFDFCDFFVKKILQL